MSVCSSCICHCTPPVSLLKAVSSGPLEISYLVGPIKTVAINGEKTFKKTISEKSLCFAFEDVHLRCRMEKGLAVGLGAIFEGGRGRGEKMVV